MSTNYFEQLSFEKKTVFIVEDNEVYSKLLQTFLQSRFPDIELKVFRIGEVCLMEMEMERNPTIVIVDYFLNSKYPEAQNGFEIIMRIKELKPQTKIIVLSALEDIALITEAIAKNEYSYIQKGDDAFKKVEQCINELLNQTDQMKFEIGLQ
ncbi:MAG TPA: response regulator [Bacteroidia bacterium]|jgi:DNA-binding NarL/FixJ family response regulator